LTITEKREWENELKTVKALPDAIKTLVNNIDNMLNEPRHKNMIIARSPYFQSAIYDYFRKIYELSKDKATF
jgi:uncharacterized iron-regulated protein